MSRKRRVSPLHPPFVQRRFTPRIEHLRPHRWNWTALTSPLDHSIARQAEEPLTGSQVRGLRFFWLDGFFSAVAENFYLGYMVLFLLAYGASNSQIGLLTAVGNLLGAAALFPGARLVEVLGRRKPIVYWSSWLARLVFLALALAPLFPLPVSAAILTIIVLNGLRAFAGNLANPAWTSMVADLVPDAIRGRYFSSRNMAMGLAALAVAPLAGWLIRSGNALLDSQVAGYQFIFLLSFAFGLAGILAFGRIEEPAGGQTGAAAHRTGDLRRAIRRSPSFVGLVISAFVWNLALQVAAPFFNVYLVDTLGATTTAVGALAAVSSFSALFGQRFFGRLMDAKGAFWVQRLSGFIIPVLPAAWMLVTAPWQVALINTLGGFIWAGYNLANFSLLLTLTPDEQRPRAVALYQTAVFSSAFIGPLLGGFLIDYISFQFVFGLSAAGRVLGALLFIYLAIRPFQRRQEAVSEAG